MESQLTTAENVYIIDEAFYMPQLDRSRRIWLYLPPEYSSSLKSYPVIYMHDGQNLFDAATAFGGDEWGVDETLNSIRNKCIIVGIDNGGDKRINEYNYHDHPEHGKGEGSAYVSFIVHTLKPYIDCTYRTLPGRQHTFTAGSSLGGLISFYAAMHHPEVFGGAGIFSPAFWIVPHIFDEMKNSVAANTSYPQQLYFYAGAKEDAMIVEPAQQMAELMLSSSQYSVQMVTDPEGNHSEATWRAAFPHFYKWIFPQQEKKHKAKK